MNKLLHFFLSTVILVFMGTAAFAQAPNAIPYQGVARNAAGNILPSQNIRLRISIRDLTAGGTVLYRETHTKTTSSLGLFSLNIGEGNILTGTLAGINWGTGAKFIQVEMDPAGGTTYTDMGTTQLMSVPYALYAGSSANLPNGTATGNTMRWNGTAWIADNALFNNGTSIGIGTTTPTTKLSVTGDANTTGSMAAGTTIANSSAILDATSTTKGFLMPRMTTAQRNAIASPAVGLQIFNLDDQCTDLYDGSNWIKTCGLKVTGTVTDPGHPTPNSWTQKANFGGVARSSAVGFSIGSKGYIGTGFDDSYKNDFWEYDPTTNAWTQKANFGGTARFYAVGFSIGSKGFIGTGYDGSYKNDFWEYDPATNAWTQKANFGGVARYFAVGFSIGSKGYIGTGYDGSNKNDFWEYDPTTNAWTQKANFGGTARRYAVGFSIGSKGYIGTGFDNSNKNDFWEYDPSTNAWTQKANFGGVARYFAVGFSIGSKGYIGTGDDGSNKNDFWEYDPSTNAWTQKANFGGTARSYAVGFSIGSKGYIGTGSDGSNKNDFWEYMDNNIITSYSSSAVSSSNTISDGAWTLANGTVYNANSGNVGIGTTTPAASAILDATSTTKGFLMPRMTTAQRNAIASPAIGLQIFNLDDQCTDLYDGSNWIKTCGLKVTGTVTDPGHPTPNSWTQKTNFGGTARYSAVGFSIGSKGYIGTGFDGSNKNDFWEYDPATNAWTQKANFGGTARYGAVGFSIGSKGYIGTGDAGSLKNDFWEYDPSTNAWTQKANFGGTARVLAVGFSIGSKGYIGTGYDGSSYKNDFWEYDPSTNAWTQRANFGGTARYYAVGFSIGSKGYIGTGYIGTSTLQNDFWAYDPVTNAWTQKANFGGTARYGAVGFSMGSNGYIGTGWDGSPKNDFWEYDPATNAWTQKANFGGTARYGAVGFSIGSKGYIGTGYDGSNKNDFWEYLDNNVTGSAYSSNLVSTTGNTISDGAWTLANGTVYNANSGNVGIGTTSPTYKFQVGDGATVSSALGFMKGYFDSNTYTAHGRMMFNDKNFGIGAGSFNGSAGDDDLYLWSWSGGSGRDIRFMSTANGDTDPNTWNTNMTIQGNTGNVGIGIPNPQFPLDVVRSDNTYAARIYNTGNNTASVALILRGGDANGSGGWLALFQDGNGNGKGTISFNGTGVQYNTTSDIRLKKNITDSKLGMDALKNIQVKDYQYKDNDKVIVQGFLAQQLYEVYPQAVTKGTDEVDEKGNLTHPWMVDYGKLTPLLVKSVQEQQVEIENLKASLKAMEEKLNKLLGNQSGN